MKNRFLSKLISGVQKILMTVMLVVFYYLGFGIAFLFSLAVNKEILRGRNASRDTFWHPGDGYDDDIHQSERQS